MGHLICPGCERSIEPLERFEKDKKKHKTWLITYCPYPRCAFNLDIEEMSVKVWNGKSFTDLDEDYRP